MSSPLTEVHANSSLVFVGVGLYLSCLSCLASANPTNRLIASPGDLSVTQTGNFPAFSRNLRDNFPGGFRRICGRLSGTPNTTNKGVIHTVSRRFS